MGDTTTMMWIAGVSPLAVFEAVIAAVIALLISGFIAAKQQHAHQPITANAEPGVTVDWGRLTIVGLILLFLVTTASMMPVERLPTPSWQAALSLDFVSAVFDNIPLTALAIKQDGYDWGFLAFAVGYGGSILWFGSSAGVALSNMYPEAKSAGRWLRHGWYVALAYVIAFKALPGH